MNEACPFAIQRPVATNIGGTTVGTVAAGGGLVGVFPGVTAVLLGVFVSVFVSGLVGVALGTLVNVLVGVFDGVLVGVLVGVFVSVFDGVLIGVFVGVFVSVDNAMHVP